MNTLDQRLEKMTPLQRAMFALKETQDRLDAIQRRQTEPIAIVGMACRFPGGASDPESFWRLLREGIHAVREVPKERWDVDAFYDPDPQKPGKMNTRWGGFIEGVEDFDNHFFGISDREATRIDPQHRLLMELAWEALEDGGLPPSSLRGSKTGVFIGISHSEYGIMLSSDMELTDAYVGTGTAHCIAANRLSFAFDFHGPSVALDTACSSSLVALHLAMQALRGGEADLALAGGVNLILSPLATVNLTKAGFSASDGKIHAFDAAATGYVRGEGAGLLVLKPLSAATRDHDPIYAVIRSTAVNQNGFSNGITAPSRQAQEKVLRQAYASAKIAPTDVQYIETQGTGTRLGDAIEAQALGAVVGKPRAEGQTCLIGSVKTNIGHLEAASGVASLMKVALALRHGELPATIHFQTPNPDIPFSDLRLKVQQSLGPWPSAVQRRIAGVSAFGFGGSNAHAVLEAATSAKPTPEAEGGATPVAQAPSIGSGVLTLSARTEKALLAQARQFADALRDGTTPWADFSYTAAARRDHHDCRLAVLADSSTQAVLAIEDFVQGRTSSHLLAGRKPFGRDLKIAFSFDGNTDGYGDNPEGLLRLVQWLGAAAEETDAILAEVTGWKLASMIETPQRWSEPRYALPAATAIRLAITQWWRKAGVVPQAVVGVGIGELAAAVAAGVLPPAEAIKLAAAIGSGGRDSASTTAARPDAKLPLFSGVDGKQHPGLWGDASDWERFTRSGEVGGMARDLLSQRGVDACIEIGVRSRAAVLARPDASGNPTDGKPSPSQRFDLRETLALLYSLGADLKWRDILGGAGKCVRVPTYPWQRHRLWVQAKDWHEVAAANAATHGLAVAPAGAKPAEAEKTREDQPVRPRPDLNTPYVAARTPLEGMLTRSWSEILRIEKVGMHDNFFELGGDSLQAMMLHNSLQDRLGEVVHGYVLFQAQTIGDLAAYMRSHFAEAVLRLHPDEPDVGQVEQAEETIESVGDREVGDVCRLLDVLAPVAPISYPIRRKNRRAVFILSPPRSGSTLFRVMLAGHDRLFSPPELELLSYNTLAEQRAAYANVPGQWLEGLVRVVMEVYRCDVDAARSIVQKWEADGLPTQEVYRLLQEPIGDRILVDKTPSYSGRLGVLKRAEELFDEPLYIHLLRHPCGMIRSYVDYNMHEDFRIRFGVNEQIPFSPRQIAELAYVVGHQNILELLRDVPASRQHRVRFEDAVGNPEASMRGVCDFLGLEYQEEMIYPYDHPERKMVDGVVSQDRMHGDQKFLVKHKGIDPKAADAWRKHTTGDFLGEPARRLAAEFGYHDIPTAPKPKRTQQVPKIRPVPRDRDLPLSLNQEALWFLDRLEPDRPTYTNYPAIRITGQLDFPALQRAFDELVRRHESLRTTFPEREGRPVQLIAPHTPIEIPLEDLSGLPESERDRKLWKLIRDEVSERIDLQRGPLIRLRAIRMAADDHVIIAATHHIIHDGWSLSVMIREMATMYTAYRLGKTPTLPELPIQYADFSVWQRELLQGEHLQQLRDYWGDKLRGVPALNLPTDYPRPPIRTTRGDSKIFYVSPELTAEVNAFSRREGVTPFMTLLAAYQVLLSRYSGQTDFAIGTPTANRTTVETEPLIGYFINMLVLRTDLSGDPTFRELVTRVRKIAVEGFEHQDLTLDQVVDELKPPRDMSRHPVFQVMFVFQNMERPSTRGLGVELKPVSDRPVGRASDFEVALQMRDTEQGFRCRLQYNTDLFSAATMEKFAAEFSDVLTQLLTKLDAPLSALPLVTEDEQRRLIGWGDRTSELVKSEGPVYRRFESRVAKSPASLAVIDGQRGWSYQTLNDHANRLAHRLIAAGVKPDQPVAVRLPRSAELIASLLGVMKSGAAYLPLDTELPEERLRFTLEDAGVEVVVTTEELAGQLPEGIREVICWGEASLLDQPATNPPAIATPDHLAYVIYTSGSTGRPKGVMLEHRAVSNYVQAAIQEYGIDAQDRVMQFASVSFDAHVEEVYPCLVQGGTLVIRTDDTIDSFQAFHARCEAMGLTVLSLPTGFWHAWAMAIDSEGLRLPGSLRMVIIGGEKARPDIIGLWFECVGKRVRLLNTYGPTETTVVSTACELAPGDASDERVVIGRPLANTRLYVLDPHQRVVPTGVAGELYIGGESVARGYLGMPELTAERFLYDRLTQVPLTQTTRARIYRTGDIVRWRPDGRLEFVGRTDDQVKLRGYRVEPGEIERVLIEHPAVASAAVVAIERAPGDLQLVAYATPRDEALIASDELRQFLAQRLPQFMVPALVIPLNRLPLTTSGKIDRKALPAPSWEGHVRQANGDPPASDVERRLATIWEELLSTAGIARSDHFFELGGNSLLALRLGSRIRHEFGVDLTLHRFFTAPTLAAMAEQIDGLLELPRSAATEITKAPAGIDIPLTPYQLPFWNEIRRSPDEPLWRVHAHLPIFGELCVDRMRETINEVIRRHEILRTAFVIDKDGRPVQRVFDRFEADLPVDDLRGIPEEGQQEKLQELSHEQKSQRFVFDRLPLFTVRLAMLSDEASVLIVTSTHLLFDDWSQRVLVGEVEEIYSALSEGRPHGLPEPKPQYRDYSAWIGRRLAGDLRTSALAYWRGKLAGVRSPRLTIANRPPAGTPGHLRFHRFRASQRQKEGLEELGRKLSASQYEILLSAFNLLLARHCESTDIAVGSFVANRPREETQGMLGVFTNGLILRNDLSGDPSFADFVTRVRQTVHEAWAFEEFPLIDVADAIIPDRDRGRFPFTQICFGYLQPLKKAAGNRRRDLRIDRETVRGDAVIYSRDLFLEMQSTEHGLAGAMRYSDSLCDASTIERLAEEYLELIDAIIANPDHRLSGLGAPTIAPEPSSLSAPLAAVTGEAELITGEAARQKGQGQSVIDSDLIEPLRRIWSELLRVDSIDPDDSFFELGGNSLLAIRLTSRIRKEFAVDFPVAELFSAKTLGGMASRIAALRTERPVIELSIPKASSGGPTRASMAQERFWRMIRRFPDRPIYLIHATLLLEGKLDIDLLKATLDQVISRHEILRTGFEETADGKLMQVIFDRVDIELPVEDLSRLSLEEAEHAIVELAGQQRSAPPEYRRPPVFKISLLRLGEERHALLLTGSHLLLDDWSVNVLMREVQELYLATVEGRPHALPELKVQYRDFAIWDRDLMEGVAGQKMLAYWRDRLAGVKNPPLPTDHPRSTTTLHIAQSHPFRVSSQLRGELDRLASLEGVSLYEIMLTAYKFLLARYCGDNDIAICTNVANRKLSDTQVMLGLFTNAVILRTDLSGDPSFHEALKRVRQTFTGAIEHEQLSFHIVADAVAPDYDHSRFAISQAGFSYQQPHSRPGGAARERVLKVSRQRIEAGPEPARLDVSLDVLVAEHGIEVCLEYDSELFDVSTIAQMADEYLSILGCVARDPQRTLSQVLVARLEGKPEVPSQLGSGISAGIATTIEGLVQTIRSEGIDEGHSLVPLRQESTGKPLFCIHGLGGHVAAFLPLAKSLPHPRPVFGLQAIGLEGETRPHDKIETMAGWYVEEIRRQQRTGPYLLCGWSMGGWIAAEVARQLRAAGQETSLIAMFDTHMHFRDFETPGVDDNAVLRWLAPRLQLDPREMQGLPLDRQWDLIAKRAEGAIGLGAEEIRNLAEVCRVQIAAATAYRPEPYDGEVILYRAQRQRGGLDPRWHTLFPKLRVEQVTGSHYTMLQLPHVTTLADSLDRHLIRAAGVNTKGQDR
ncbi:MAG: hypothetical protein RI963_1763 [Planctomycetota bacterium]